jgi:hypothetical protein
VRASNPTNRKREAGNMRDWSFSASAEWVIGVLLVVVIVAAAFV